jgi:HAMP domain-containing protein
MKLLVKINLGLVAVFSIGFVATGFFTRAVLEQNAEREVISSARLMMESAAAARGYTTGEIKPLLAPQLAKTFLPQSVPSYAATQSFAALHKSNPDYSYKEATLNPTNPRDRVVDWEADVVQRLRDHAESKEFIGKRNSEAGPSLYLARPIRINDAQCLSCHSTPAAAPASMLALYGSNNGFGWKLGEVVGSQIVSVPLDVALRQADRTVELIMTGFALSFAALLLFVNAVMYWLVLRPMQRMARIADAVSEGRADAPPFPKGGSDELAVLGTAFTRMRRSMDKALALLD